jgi:hypothetical protein
MGCLPSWYGNLFICKAHGQSNRSICRIYERQQEITMTIELFGFILAVFTLFTIMNFFERKNHNWQIKKLAHRAIRLKEERNELLEKRKAAALRGERVIQEKDKEIEKQKKEIESLNNQVDIIQEIMEDQKILDQFKYYHVTDRGHIVFGKTLKDFQ